MPTLDSILQARPELKKVVEEKPTLASSMDELEKMGQRHGKKDKALVQSAHDSMAALVDGMHCAAMDTTEKGAAFAKANARHSKADIQRISDIHDACLGLGASCPSAEKKTSEG